MGGFRKAGSEIEEDGAGRFEGMRVLDLYAGSGALGLEALSRGAAAVLLVDYGFPSGEYFHPQRHMGTLMCHQGHRADGDALNCASNVRASPPSAA